MVSNSGFRGAMYDASVKGAIGIGLGVLTDFMVETFRVPVLNDSGTFGNANISNFEVAAYALSLAGTVAGIVDIVVSKGVITFTKDTFPIFLGFGIGVQQYESWIADKIGIRAFNPYETVGGYIPPVLPSETELPFLEGAAAGPEFWAPEAGSPIEIPIIGS